MVLALSAVDYDHLARTVQVETHLGSFDEYCVAASIINRVKSPLYPNTVADVVYAPGQYEGFLYKRPAANRDVVARLKNNKNMLKAFGIIGARTNFKGQSQLPHRVPSEDPMCSPKGNFYHYHWQ